jgi:uncharacterized protein YbaR (Trm112 family)
LKRSAASRSNAPPSHPGGTSSSNALKTEESMALSSELLSILVCPACKGDLVYDEPGRTLTCNHCRLRYKISDDIPVMLIDEAEKF